MHPFFQYARNYINRIFETETYPHARTFRTNFKEKIEDAFWFFIMLFSYAILRLRLILSIPTFWCIKKLRNNPLGITSLLILPLCLTGLPSAVIGIYFEAMAVGAVILTSPIIWLVHKIAMWKTKSLRKQISLLAEENGININRIYSQRIRLDCKGTAANLILEFRNLAARDLTEIPGNAKTADHTITLN